MQLKRFATLLFSISLLCCLLPLQARQHRSSVDTTLDELRLELSDVKHELKGALVEINLLDERLRKQNQSSQPTSPLLSLKSEITQLSSQIATLDRKTTQLEKLIEKVTTDLRNINTYTTQAYNQIASLEKQIALHDKRLSEISQLKGTLTSISKAISSKPSDEVTVKTYRVKAGDSLEKIARNHKTTTDTLKKLNHLQSDKIIVGQELKVSDEQP